MRARAILPLLIASFSIPAVLGWGSAGHEIVATIAQIHLHPSVFPSICTILNFTSTNPNEPLCHLAPIATWADRIRFKMRWSAALHYIGALDDHPSQTCLFPGERGWAGKKGGNVLGAIRNVTNILEDWVGDENVGLAGAEDDRANEALKFLVHFVGDMHQPLHLTGRDRGGNSVKVLFDGRQTNLHSLWDSLLIAKALRTVPSNYSRPLPSQKIEQALRGTIYDSYVRRVMWEGVLGKWKEEIPSWLACPAATPSSTGESAGMWQQVMLMWGKIGRGGAEETDDELLCPHYWAEPIHTLNCEIVWPKAIDEPPYSHPYRATSPCESSSSELLTLEEELAMVDEAGNYIGSMNPSPGGPYLELDTPEYTGAISKQWLVEKLMAQAGVRLAGVLNWLFADFEDGEGILGNRGLRVVDI